MNPAKSKLFVFSNLSRDLANNLSLTNGIPLTDHLGVYLGVPIVHGRASKELYSPLVDKVLNRFADWKGKLLNPAGRKTLIQSTTSAIPFYTMQTALLPVSVCSVLAWIKCSVTFFGEDQLSKAGII